MAREEAAPTAIPGHLARTGREPCLVQPYRSLLRVKRQLPILVPDSIGHLRLYLGIRTRCYLVIKKVSKHHPDCGRNSR